MHNECLLLAAQGFQCRMYYNNNYTNTAVVLLLYFICDDYFPLYIKCICIQ